MSLPRSPSVFELIACDHLKSGLREALRYLLDNINKVDSRRRLRTDEAILLLDLLIEYNYLKSYNASYAENLYNLVRVTAFKGTSTTPRDGRLLPSLVCLTLIPYIKRKLDRYFEDLNYKETRTASELHRIRLYKLFCRSYSLLNLVFLVRFAAGKSTYHNFLDGLLSIRLENCDAINDDSLDISTWSARISKFIADFMGQGLTAGSYLIQFLDYWNSRSNSAPLFNSSLPIPDPPRRDEFAYSDEGSSDICLICLHVRQNECALSNTGYVFCYSCLQRYVTARQCCPVTGLPTTVDNIVKMFTASTPF